jgi:hypothetical protein
MEARVMTILMAAQTPTNAMEAREQTPLQAVRTPSQRCLKKTTMMKDLETNKQFQSKNNEGIL